MDNDTKQLTFLEKALLHLNMRLGYSLQHNNKDAVMFIDSVIVKLLDRIEILDAAKRREDEFIQYSDYLDAVEYRGMSA
jgi:hypothetical protein